MSKAKICEKQNQKQKLNGRTMTVVTKWSEGVFVVDEYVPAEVQALTGYQDDRSFRFFQCVADNTLIVY